MEKEKEKEKEKIEIQGREYRDAEWEKLFYYFKYYCGINFHVS